MNPITQLHEDINNRIAEECEKIKEAADPVKEIEEYVWNIQWYSPGLAKHVEKEILSHINIPVYVSRYVPPPPSRPIPPRK